MKGGARKRYTNRSRSRSRGRSTGAASSGAAASSTGPAASSSGSAPASIQGGVDFERHVHALHLSGKLSAKEVQRLSASATLDGALSVANLAAAGKHGAYPGNIHRDLMRKMLKQCTLPQLYYAPVPTHNPATQTNNEIVMIPFLLVHEVLASMVKNSQRTLREYCDCSPSVERLVADFCTKTNVPRTGVVPIGFHGDGVPHQKIGPCRYFLGTFWPSPLQRGCYSR